MTLSFGFPKKESFQNNKADIEMKDTIKRTPKKEFKED